MHAQDVGGTVHLRCLRDRGVGIVVHDAILVAVLIGLLQNLNSLVQNVSRCTLLCVGCATTTMQACVLRDDFADQPTVNTGVALQNAAPRL